MTSLDLSVGLQILVLVLLVGAFAGVVVVTPFIWRSGTAARKPGGGVGPPARGDEGRERARDPGPIAPARGTSADR
jgi:hypothetical protein